MKTGKDDSDRKLVYLLGHKSIEAAKESFANFRKDPDWLAAREASEKKAGGSLTEKEGGVVSEFFVATAYSPLQWGRTMATPQQPDNSDPYDLGRFLAAQQGTYEHALREIRSGQKRTHWMWFVFPQIQGLGYSDTARFFAITGPDEARAYLAHPVLGPRLLEITMALLGVGGKSAHEIFGAPDDTKLRSCATLFASVSAPRSIFEQVLARFFGGEPDQETVRRLG